ncbi:MAG: hypothetical protein M5U25_03020 [Planctomycetota bacterium]|nr:hypothetical protein [Planctomycetota bacterium]
MDLARFELSRAIKDFVGDRYFAIVVYGTEHECPTGGWVYANEANCSKWSKAALELDFMGMTNIHGALLHALQVSDKGDKCDEPAVDANCVLTGADTIVFLTDGWASWDDQSTARVKDKRNNIDNSVGDGPFIYSEDIWPDILRQNLFRKVIISCVGIGNHDKELLSTMAKKTGGGYVDWSFPSNLLPCGPAEGQPCVSSNLLCSRRPCCWRWRPPSSLTACARCPSRTTAKRLSANSSVCCPW